MTDNEFTETMRKYKSLCTHQTSSDKFKVVLADSPSNIDGAFETKRVGKKLIITHYQNGKVTKKTYHLPWLLFKTRLRHLLGLTYNPYVDDTCRNHSKEFKSRGN